MASLYRELCKYLADHGCTNVRQGKGSHEIWYSPVSDRSFAVVRNLKKRETANAICKQAGLPKRF